MIYALALTKLGRNARRRPAPDHAQGIGAGHTSVGQLAGATGSGGEEGRGKKPRPALARRGRGSILLREHDGEHPHRLRWVTRVFRAELHRGIVIIQLEKELPPRDFKAAEVVLLVGIVVRQASCAHSSRVEDPATPRCVERGGKQTGEVRRASPANHT